jgi:hypothetical protein
MILKATLVLPSRVGLQCCQGIVDSHPQNRVRVVITGGAMESLQKWLESKKPLCLRVTAFDVRRARMETALKGILTHAKRDLVAKLCGGLGNAGADSASGVDSTTAQASARRLACSRPPAIPHVVEILSCLGGWQGGTEDAQMRAVALALNTEDVAIIHGPPGEKNRCSRPLLVLSLFR